MIDYNFTGLIFYRKLFKNYKIKNKLEKIKNELDKFKYEKSIKRYIPFCTPKYTCFILIKNQNNIIFQEIHNFSNNGDINICFLRIERKIKNLDNAIKKDVSIEICILNNKERRSILNLKKEFCKLFKEFNPPTKKNLFFSLSDFISKHFIFIILSLTFVFTLIIVDKLSDIGILIKFMSIETLSLIINISIKDLSTLFILVALGFCVYVFLLVYYPYKKENFCSTMIDLIVPFLKFFLSIIILRYFYIVIIHSLKGDESVVFQDIAKKYITEVRYPSLKQVIVKIEDNKEKEVNKGEYILLLNNDDNFIFYLKSETVKNILKKTKNNICQNLSDEKSNYLDSLVKLLYLKGEDYKNKDDIEKYKTLYLVSNQRYQQVKISDVTLKDEIPEFKEAFCTKQIEETKK